MADKTKKALCAVNLLLAVFTAVMCFVYRANYSIVLKAVTASGFVLMGAVNLGYTFFSKKKILFPLLTFFGLSLCMAGDVVLFNDFIAGALIFVLGHLLYIAAYCVLCKPAWRDVIVTAAVSSASVLFVTLYPAFSYGSFLMTAVAVVYALVISFMLGKALSNAIGSKDGVSLTLLAGSVMFFVSDLALAFSIFGGDPSWASPLCMFTYFPGQCVIAFSVYLYNIKKQLP